MTKRILSLILAGALCVGLLAGCSGKDDNADKPADDPSVSQGVDTDPAVSVDLQAFYDKMMNAAVEPPMMMPLEGEMLEGFYPGLSAIDTKQAIVAMPAMTGQAIEFAFVEVANAADAKAGKDIFQARIDSVVNAEMNYPTTLEVWQTKSEIVEMGNFVCLFVHADKDVLVKAFREGTDVPAWCEPEIIDDEANYADEGAEGDTVIGGSDAPTDIVVADPVESDTPVIAPAEPSAEPSVAPSQEPAASTSMDLAATYEKWYAELNPLDENGDPTGPSTMDLAEMPEMLEGYYAGLSAIETKQMMVLMPMISAVPYEIALIEVANESDVESVKAIFQSRIDSQLDPMGMNYPMIVENWELNSRIVSNGNYIMLVASELCDTFVEKFNAQF